MPRMRTMHYCEVCGRIATDGKSHNCEPKVLARIAELELANHDLEFHVAVLERTLNNSAEAGYPLKEESKK